MRAARCLGLGLVLAVAPAAAQQEPGQGLRLLQAASARYETVTRLCADFTQHLSVPLLDEERSGSGRLCQERPDRFAMRFTDPVGDAIVVDGTWVWIYYPSVDPKQVIRLSMRENQGGVDFHREFLSEPEAKYVTVYEGEDEVAGHPTHRLRLTPRSVTSYEAAVVWIDRAAPVLRQVRVEEENGSARTVTLVSVELNARVPQGWFVFAPPPGTQVITR